MTLKLTLFSQEEEDFVLEILVDSDARFSELHQLILDDCGYVEHPGQCFYICDEDCRVRHRISLKESENTNYDEDIDLMSQTRLCDFLEDEGQRLIYLFDPDDKRFFLMELTENVFGRTVDKAVVNRRHGQAPLQTLYADEPSFEMEGPAGQPSSPAGDEPEEYADDFYGDEGYEADELDFEGYEIDE